MKFAVDAHLPPGLCDLLRLAGHEAIHTSQLPAGNQTSDVALNTLSVKEHWVVISKDADFFHSHLLHGKPWKLLLVRTGNIRTRELKALFERHLPEIIAAFEDSTIVEIDRLAVRPWR
jgi:predicted nuclease of predicted toxin-antitoxin system